jgi:hypothetical protein
LARHRFFLTNSTILNRQQSELQILNPNVQYYGGLISDFAAGSLAVGHSLTGRGHPALLKVPMLLTSMPGTTPRVEYLGMGDVNQNLRRTFRR